MVDAERESELAEEILRRHPERLGTEGPCIDSVAVPQDLLEPDRALIADPNTRRVGAAGRVGADRARALTKQAGEAAALKAGVQQEPGPVPRDRAPDCEAGLPRRKLVARVALGIL